LINTLPRSGMPPSLDIRVHDSLESLQHLRPEWDALLGEFPSATTFSTWEWLAPWWRAFGGDDRLRVLELRDPSSQALAALAPFALARQRVAGLDLRVLRLMGDGSGDSDNLDLPVRTGYELAASRALLGWFEDHKRDWNLCRLYTLPSHSPVGNQLLKDVKARGWTCFTATQPRLVVELPESWELYLKMLSSNERGNLGRRTRRLEESYRVRIYRCTSVDQLDGCLRALFDLHRKRWQARGLSGSFESGARRQFYHEMGALLIARARLHFWLLELDGKLVAAQFGFRHGNTLFHLQEGFDLDYSADSVGYILRGQVMKELITEGVRQYDFLGGSDPAKLRWGAQARSYLNIEFARPYTRGSASLRLTRGAHSAKRWLRARLSPRLWRALKSIAGVRSQH
jgi:CelD/BcsL family acetyltransferase involved in cellulose biosynthesis